jgi:hypothetical protein
MRDLDLGDPRRDVFIVEIPRRGACSLEPGSTSRPRDFKKALPGISAIACLPRVERIYDGFASCTWSICAKCN